MNHKDDVPWLSLRFQIRERSSVGLLGCGIIMSQSDQGQDGNSQRQAAR
jgi:hypothetical protein